MKKIILPLLVLSGFTLVNSNLFAVSGTWASAANGDWTVASNWLDSNEPNGVGDIAAISINATAIRTVTLNTARTVGQLVSQAGGSANPADPGITRIWRLLGSGTLTLDNGANIPVVKGINGPFTVGVVLAGTQGVELANGGGSQTLLTAANTYTGDTEIVRGIAEIGNVNALPSFTGNGRTGNVLFVDKGNGPGTLDLNGFSITINGFSSAIAGAGSVLGGTVTTRLGTGTYTLTVGDNDQTSTFNGVINNGSGTIGLTKIGTGTLTLTGDHTYTGETRINGGELRLNGSGAIGSSAIVTIGPGGTLDVSTVSSSPYVLNWNQTLNGSGATGVINGGLTLDSLAGLTLTYTPGTPTLNVAGGTLTLNGNPTTVNVVNPLFDGNYKLISKSGSGTVFANSLGTVTVGGAGIGGGGTPSLSVSDGELYLTISGGATAVEWGSGNGTWAVGVTGWNSGGTTAFANGNAALFTDTYSTGNPIITLNSEVLPQGVIVNSTKHYTITGTGDIGGSAQLSKLNTGTLTLAVANAHTGGSTLFAGTLNLNNGSALGAASGTFAINGGTLDNTSGGPITMVNYPQAWNGNFAFTGTQNLNLGAGAVTLSATRTVTVNGGTLTADGDISGSGFGLIKAGAGTLALNGVLGTDGGGVTVNGGILSLGGNNTFTGGVAINNGELIVNHPGALNSTSPNIVTMPDDAASKILSLNGNSVTVANLTKSGVNNPGAAVIRNNHPTTPATLTVSVPSGAVSFVGTLTDGGAAPLAFTKIGTGTFTFGGGGGGSGTYSGNTTISGGVLRPGANNIFPHGAGKGNMIIAASATLDMLDRQPITVNGLSGSGVVNSSDKGGLPGISVFNVGDGDASADFSGVIQNVPAPGKTAGTITLVKIGTGTQTLSGVNTYSGTTTVNAGALLVNSPGSIPNTTVTVNAGGTLGGDGTINGPVTVNAGGSIAAGASAGALTLANGLDLSAGGTNVWELAALKDDSDGTPGVDFDQLVISGGTLTLGGSSTLSLRFTGGASAPDGSNPFWQSTRTWTIISAAGAASDFAAIENGVYAAGSFSTSVEAGGIVLTFTPGGTPAPVTDFTITPGPGNDLTLSYTGGSGAQFVLLQTNNIAAPLNQWARLKTNTLTPGTFLITPGSDPRQFYRVKSE